MTSAIAPPRPLPGDLAMWFFIVAELSVFGLMIMGFTVTEALHSDSFRSSRARLDTSTGLTLTLSLLTSGFFAALAVAQVRRNQQRIAALLLVAAVISSLFYTVIKLTEYQHLAALGLDIEYDVFFTLYWILTGFHFLHVLLGLVILLFMALRCWRQQYSPQHPHNLESGVLYWHMVDLVWVMLFPLVYVLN